MQCECVRRAHGAVDAQMTCWCAERSKRPRCNELLKGDKAQLGMLYTCIVGGDSAAGALQAFVAVEGFLASGFCVVR